MGAVSEGMMKESELEEGKSNFFKLMKKKEEIRLQVWILRQEAFPEAVHKEE